MNTPKPQSGSISLTGPAPEAQRNRGALWFLVLGSTAVHVLILAALGSLVIFRHIFKDEAQFQAHAPARPTLEPRKLEYKVRLKEQQKRSGRPRVQPRIRAALPSSLNLPELKFEFEPVKDPLQSRLRSFGAAGLGAGFGGGLGDGGLGISSSKVSVFGIKQLTERIAILIDVSPSMIEDEKGGIPGFDELKGEIGRVIQSLPETSFFNLVMFAHGLHAMSSSMLLATSENKAKAVAFLTPYATEKTIKFVPGQNTQMLIENNLTPQHTIERTHGFTRYDLALAAAFEMGADAIFVISDGGFDIYRFIDPAKREAEIIRRFGSVEAMNRMSQEIKDRIAKETEERQRKGLPPRAYEQVSLGVDEGLPEAEALTFLESLSKEVYAEKGKREPRIHVIGYIPRERTQFLKDIAQRWRGRYKEIRPLARPIKSE